MDFRIGWFLGLLACSSGGSVSDDMDTDTDTDTDTNTEPDFWQEWFADYNAGQGTEYLERTGTRTEAGDPRFPALPAHFYIDDAAYGPFSRNTLDFWGVNTDKPAPVVVYIHGGGFIANDTEQLHQRGQTLPKLLASGVAVASISYRYTYANPDKAEAQGQINDTGTDPNVDGARLDVVLRDCARAVQYLRYRADALHIDATRIGAWGTSAGGGCTMWMGTVPDLANPDHDDPVLRESTRLQALGHVSSQVSYDFMDWSAHLDMDADFIWERLGQEARRFTQLSKAELESEAGVALRGVLNYYEHFGPEDPPFYTENNRQDLGQEETDDGTLVHHPRGHVALYERCVNHGGRCEIKTRIEHSNYSGDINDFMIEILK